MQGQSLNWLLGFGDVFNSISCVNKMSTTTKYKYKYKYLKIRLPWLVVLGQSGHKLCGQEVDMQQARVLEPEADDAPTWDGPCPEVEMGRDEPGGDKPMSHHTLLHISSCFDS